MINPDNPMNTMTPASDKLLVAALQAMLNATPEHRAELYQTWISNVCIPDLNKDITKILLDIVPGEDGMGLEIYATCVADVEAAFTRMEDRIEQLELKLEATRSLTLSSSEEEMKKTRDATRYRWLRLGGAYKVRCKGATFHIGPHFVQAGSTGYSEAFDEGVDEGMQAWPGPNKT